MFYIYIFREEYRFSVSTCVSFRKISTCIILRTVHISSTFSNFQHEVIQNIPFYHWFPMSQTTLGRHWYSKSPTHQSCHLCSTCLTWTSCCFSGALRMKELLKLKSSLRQNQVFSPSLLSFSLWDLDLISSLCFEEFLTSNVYVYFSAVAVSGYHQQFWGLQMS